MTQQAIALDKGLEKLHSVLCKKELKWLQPKWVKNSRNLEKLTKRDST